MSNKTIKDEQIPICLKIYKWNDTFYIVRNFYEDYQTEISWYKIIISSELKIDFHIDLNKTIKISNSFFEELKNDNNKIYLLENEIAKLFDSKWLNLKRFWEYIDNIYLNLDYCLLSDKVFFLESEQEIKKDLLFWWHEIQKDISDLFDDKINFKKIIENKIFKKHKDNYDIYKKIEKLKLETDKKNIRKYNEKVKKLESIEKEIKENLISYQKLLKEKIQEKIHELTLKITQILSEKIEINQIEYKDLTKFEKSLFIENKNNKSEIIYTFNFSFTDFIFFKSFIKTELWLKESNIIDLFIKDKENKIQEIIKDLREYKYKDGNIDLIKEICDILQIDNVYTKKINNNLILNLWFINEKFDINNVNIKKVDYDYLQNYKNHLLEKYKDSSPEIQNFINDLYYLPIEHWDNFNNLINEDKGVKFDLEKFKNDNKLSLYNFQKSKWQEFDYIINQEIFTKNKNHTFSKVRKTQKDSIFQVLTLDKISDSRDVFLIDENNEKQNKELLEKYENYFENFHKNILPVFFIEWWSYYILNKKYEKIDYYFIKYDTKIWNKNKYFAEIWELDFVIFPYKWLNWFIDEMVTNLNKKLIKENTDLKAWKVKSTLKQTQFYTNKRLLLQLNDILKRIKNNLQKNLQETKSEDFINDIKYIDHRVLQDIASKIDYKPWDNLQEKLKEISHQKIINHKKEITLDNASNRMVKFILKKLLKEIKSNAKLKNNPYNQVKNIKDILYELDEVFDIENIWDVNIDTQILLNPDYFKLFKFYNDSFRFISWISTDIDEDNYVKSVSKMFEIYCFETIKDLLKDIDFENSKKIDFKKSESKVLHEEWEKKKKTSTYISHEDFIKDKFADKKSKWVDIEWFLQSNFNWNKLRLILWDIYHRWNVIHDYIETVKINVDKILDIKSEEKQKKDIEIKKITEKSLLYPENYRNMDYSWIFWDEFNFCKLDNSKFYKNNKDLKMPAENIMTPDLSIEIRDINNNIIKTIIFDAKFSAIWDEINQIEIPNKDRFRELQKYQKIWYQDSEWVFKPFLKNPIMIMYPWDINSGNLNTLKTINNILKQTNNMTLIPIYSDQNKDVKDCIKEILKEEIEKV